MAYTDRLNELKSALEGYSESEEKLLALYETAIKNAEQGYADAVKQVNDQYLRDRNDAYTDSARDERNAYNILASRGLGFSGEAAQTKLNSNILLSNRLGDLTGEKNSRMTELAQGLAESKNDIASQQAQARNDINERRSNLLADIAAMESEREQSQAALEAEKELTNAKLKAEKEMQAAELNAKYNSIQNGNADSAGVEDGSQNTNGEETIFSPDVSPKDLAKLMVSNVADGKHIESEDDAYIINKYLLDIRENYNLDSAYMDELIFMLKAYGYEDIGEKDARVMVISRDADAYYDERYADYYNSYVTRLRNEYEAKRYARVEAQRDALDYIYKRTGALEEFKKICKEAGFSDEIIESYAKNIVWGKKEETAAENIGYGGGNPSKNTVNMLK